MVLIGLDVATQGSKTGLAIGRWSDGVVTVLDASLCPKGKRTAEVVASWLQHDRQALLAIDAPLGWPAPLGSALIGHRAGEAILVSANELFRRETDRFVKSHTGKTPLDVGADRIARTARAALGILGDLRVLTASEVPLAWDRESLPWVSAIEVYPAATLIAHGFRSSGYKRPAQQKERAQLVEQLRDVLVLPSDVSKMLTNPDVLDATVCLLAAKDFLVGRALTPVHDDLARREGWISCTRCSWTSGWRASKRFKRSPV